MKTIHFNETIHSLSASGYIKINVHSTKSEPYMTAEGDIDWMLKEGVLTLFSKPVYTQGNTGNRVVIGKNNIVINGDNLGTIINGHTQIAIGNGNIMIGGNNNATIINNNADCIEINLYLNTLSNICLAGNVHFKMQEVLNSSFALHMTGESQAVIDCMDEVIDSLDLVLSGSTRVKLKGHCQSLSATISGTSQLKAKKMISDTIHIGASGTSTAKVHATQYIDAHSSGVSKIEVYGQPIQQLKQSSGLSNIKFI